MNGVFITGTDTGIGKTTFAKEVMRRHPDATYWKPVQTGWPADDDTKTVGARRSLPGLRYAMPVSPHRAAANEGDRITLDKIMVMDAQGRGFVIVPWHKWIRKNTLVARYSLSLPHENIRNGLDKLSDRLGDAYDTWSLIGFLLLRFGGLTRNVTDSKDKLVCSEAVALFLDHAGLEFGDIGRITPRDLLLLAESTPDVFGLEESIDGFRELLMSARRQGPSKPLHEGGELDASSDVADSELSGG